MTPDPLRAYAEELAEYVTHLLKAVDRAAIDHPWEWVEGLGVRRMRPRRGPRCSLLPRQCAEDDAA